MKHFMIQCSSITGFYAVDEYAKTKQEALNAYRDRWCPYRQRLPKDVAIWEAA